MDKTALLTKLRRQREKVIDLDATHSVTILRPPEEDLGSMLSGTGESRVWAVEPAHVRKYVCGWKGFTEEDVLGKGVGGTDPLDFDADLWSALVADNVAWLNKVADGILKAIVAHVKAKAEVEKNSAPA